jgi:hypothetical protein
MVEHVIQAKRIEIWKDSHVLQRETWMCPYCQSHATYRGKIHWVNTQQQFTELAKTWK